MTRLIALDIDGTVLSPDGQISEATHREVRRLRDEGDVVMLATGRSAFDTFPVARRLDITPPFLVTANGAMTMALEDGSYQPWRIETFQPADALLKLREVLEGAFYATEGVDGIYRYCGRFPEGAFEAQGEEVPFAELLEREATRVVVVAPDETIENFMAKIESSGLHSVSYSVGWAAWLDIAPDGVNKATALERVREALDIPRDNVVVAGDGRNDIEMLRWAREGGGVAIAMGQAPLEVLDASTRIAPDFEHDGLARALADLT